MSLYIEFSIKIYYEIAGFVTPTTLAAVQAIQAAAAQQHFGGHFQAPQQPPQQQQPPPQLIQQQQPEMVKPVDKPTEEENKKPPGYATPDPVLETNTITTTKDPDQMPTIDDWSEDVAKEEDSEANKNKFRDRKSQGRGNFRGRGGM